MSELTEMEQYLQKLFTQAGNDLKKKFLKYTQDFQRLDAERQQAVEDGRMTEDEYKEWRKNKLLYGMHWQRLIDRNTSELLKYNQTAVKYINGEVPQIFASGYNKVAEQIPDSPVAGFDFELINADTVNNLVHEDGIILPPKKKVDPEKDKAWNAKLINAQLLQGILQGESIPEMAKRMQTVANSDLAGATRTARTMHTAAQNAGRQSGYNKAAEQGAVFEKTWLAANNERTRLSHSLMNGQTVAHDEKFVSPVTGVKLMFPGDWNAEGGDVGSEIYNCRCTLITKFKGFKKLNGEEPERIEHEIPKEEAKHEPETKSYITAINDLRQKFNGTSDIYERERIVCEAGREMVNAHYENGYYSRLEELRNEMNSIYKEYNEKINELRTAYRELDKERRNPEYRRKPEEYEKLTKAIDEAYQKWREAEKERDKILNPLRNEERTTRKEMLEFRKELLKEVRECGTDHKMKDFFRGTKRVQEVAFDCLSNYPKEWVEAIRQDGILDCAEIGRGFYSYSEKKLRLSDNLVRCGYHELGHAIEHNVQAVLDAEKAFYERRTKDEKLEWMGPPYKKSEKSRKDNFINIYMGKDYGGKAYELVSMGFESYFADSFEIEHDEDYQEFIMGVLAIC